jgi:hypothetical protein
VRSRGCLTHPAATPRRSLRSLIGGRPTTLPSPALPARWFKKVGALPLASPPPSAPAAGHRRCALVPGALRRLPPPHKLLYKGPSAKESTSLVPRSARLRSGWRCPIRGLGSIRPQVARTRSAWRGGLGSAVSRLQGNREGKLKQCKIESSQSMSFLFKLKGGGPRICAGRAQPSRGSGGGSPTSAVPTTGTFWFSGAAGGEAARRGSERRRLGRNFVQPSPVRNSLGA